MTPRKRFFLSKAVKRWRGIFVTNSMYSERYQTVTSPPPLSNNRLNAYGNNKSSRTKVACDSPKVAHGCLPLGSNVLCRFPLSLGSKFRMDATDDESLTQLNQNSLRPSFPPLLSPAPYAPHES